MTTVRELCRFLNDLAPLALAEDWDNVGLLLGDEQSDVDRVLTCLTLTPDVADEAIASGVGFIVTHHPVLFKAVQRLSTATSEGRMLTALMRRGVAVYSPHTAYDNAPRGINQQLAEALGLVQIQPLRPRLAGDSFKLVTTVPEPDHDAVRQAVWSTGAGTIGDYRDCSFSVRGVGTFFGTDSANPAVGLAGRLEHVEEVRVEFVCPADRLTAALAALRQSHPYEEPAIDVFVLKGLPGSQGSGRMGVLPQPLTLGELVQRVGSVLEQRVVAYVGDVERPVERIGIACGAAGEFLRDAVRRGCQAFLTGEARFHSCLEGRDLQIGVILPGHYATERPAMEELARRVTQAFPQLQVTASQCECDPVQYLGAE